MLDYIVGMQSHIMSKGRGNLSRRRDTTMEMDRRVYKLKMTDRPVLSLRMD